MSSSGFCATVGDKQLGVRLLRRFRAAMPTRQAIEDNRWLRPVAHRVLHPALWRFTRRSVPRGVALGLLTGILIPLGQIPASAILALPLRANVPVAAATTFLTNPVTTPPLWLFAYWVGTHLLRLDSGAAMGAQAVANTGWMQWLFAEAGPALITGLIVVAVTGAALGYALSALGWRWWIAAKWRRRRRGK